MVRAGLLVTSIASAVPASATTKSWMRSSVQSGVELRHDPAFPNPGRDRVMWDHCDGNICPLALCTVTPGDEHNVPKASSAPRRIIRGGGGFVATAENAADICRSIGGRLPTVDEVKLGLYIDAPHWRADAEQTECCATDWLGDVCDTEPTTKLKRSDWIITSERCVTENHGYAVVRVDGHEKKCVKGGSPPEVFVQCVSNLADLCVCITPCAFYKTTVFDPLKWCQTLPSCPTATMADAEHASAGRALSSLQSTPGGKETAAAWVHCEAPLYSFPKLLATHQRKKLASVLSRRDEALVFAEKLKSMSPADLHAIRQTPMRERTDPVVRPLSMTEVAIHAARHYVYIAPAAPDGLGTDVNWVKVALLISFAFKMKVVLPHAQMISENSPQYLAGNDIITPFGTPPSDLFHSLGLDAFPPTEEMESKELFDAIDKHQLQARYVNMFGRWDIHSEEEWWLYETPANEKNSGVNSQIHKILENFDTNPKANGREGALIIKMMPTGSFNWVLGLAEWYRYAYRATRAVLRPQMPLSLTRFSKKKLAVIVAIRMGDLLLPQYAGATSRLMPMGFYNAALSTLYGRALLEKSGGRKMQPGEARFTCENSHILIVTQMPPAHGKGLDEARLKLTQVLKPISDRFAKGCVSVAVCKTDNECEAEETSAGALRALYRDVDTFTSADVLVGSRSSSISRLVTELARPEAIKLLPFDDLEVGPTVFEGIEGVLELCSDHGAGVTHGSFDLKTFDKLWARRTEAHTQIINMASPRGFSMPHFSHCRPHCRIVRHVGERTHVSCTSLNPLHHYKVFVDKSLKPKEMSARLASVRAELAVVKTAHDGAKNAAGAEALAEWKTKYESRYGWLKKKLAWLLQRKALDVDYEDLQAGKSLEGTPLKTLAKLLQTRASNSDLAALVGSGHVSALIPPRSTKPGHEGEKVWAGDDKVAVEFLTVPCGSACERAHKLRGWRCRYVLMSAVCDESGLPTNAQRKHHHVRTHTPYSLSPFPYPTHTAVRTGGSPPCSSSKGTPP